MCPSHLILGRETRQPRPAGPSPFSGLGGATAVFRLSSGCWFIPCRHIGGSHDHHPIETQAWSQSGYQTPVGDSAKTRNTLGRGKPAGACLQAGQGTGDGGGQAAAEACKAAQAQYIADFTEPQPNLQADQEGVGVRRQPARQWPPRRSSPNRRRSSPPGQRDARWRSGRAMSPTSGRSRR